MHVLILNVFNRHSKMNMKKIKKINKNEKLKKKGSRNKNDMRYT